MSRLIASAKIETKTTIELSECELRALHEIAKFGADTIIEKLRLLSDRVTTEHRSGLWSFFDELHQNGSGVVSAIDRARKEFHGVGGKK